jgi:hypothetical protein
MQLRSGLTVAIVSIVLAAILAVHPAAAFDFTVSNPVIHGNLAVYPVHGPGQGGGNLLTLDEAAQQGAVAIHQTEEGPLRIVNLSDRGLFVQAGTLLLGGLQDQVVSADTIVGPHSNRPLYTYCVDPFRAAARSDANPNFFASTGTLFPWRAANLSLMTGQTESASAPRLRQAGVWWSIDTLRSRLSERIGEALEPARIPVWSRDENRERRAHLQLAARTSAWTTSLPLALQNERLAQVIEPYLNALQRVADGQDVIGVVIAIDGKFTSADVYGSSNLMRRMWPALARAAAVEAVAEDMGTAPPVPSVVAAKAFLEAALTAPAQVPPPALANLWSDAHGFALTGLRETESTLASETVTSDGSVHRGVIAKLDPAAATDTPAALIVQMLAANSVKLNDGEVVVLQRGAQDRWIADVRSVPRVAAAIEPLMVPTDRIATVSMTSELARLLRRTPPDVLSLAVLVAVLLAWFGTLLALLRRRRRIASRVTPVAEVATAIAGSVQADEGPSLSRHYSHVTRIAERPRLAGAARPYVAIPPRLRAA